MSTLTKKNACRKFYFIFGSIIVLLFLISIWAYNISKTTVSKTIIIQSVSSSSQMDNYGPDVLATGTGIAWHAQSPAQFPETLTFTFHSEAELSDLELFPQNGDPGEMITRAPGRIMIFAGNSKESGGELFLVAEAELTPDNYRDGAADIQFDKPIVTDKIVLEIYSTSGNRNLLTLQKVDFY